MSVVYCSVVFLYFVVVLWRCVVVVALVLVVFYLSICLAASLKTKLFSETFSVFELNIKNAAIQRDFLSFWTWQGQKRSNSARLPQFSKLTISKAKQFLRDFLQKYKVECRAQGLVPMRFAIFHSIYLQYCACHETVRPGHTKCCTCHTKASYQNLKIWCSKMPPLSGNQHPDLLTCLTHVSLVHVWLMCL